MSMDSVFFRIFNLIKSQGQTEPRDETSSKQLYNAARDLMLEMESPGDTIQRIAYSVSCILL